MIYKWESRQERLLKYMRIPPVKKLEWLCEMHEFLRQAFTKKQRDIYYKLRQTR